MAQRRDKPSHEEPRPYAGLRPLGSNPLNLPTDALGGVQDAGGDIITALLNLLKPKMVPNDIQLPMEGPPDERLFPNAQRRRPQ